MEVTVGVHRFCFLFSFPLGPCKPSRWQRSREGCETWFLGPCAYVSVELVSPAPLDSPSRHSRLVDLQKVQTLDAFSQLVIISAVVWCSVLTWVLVSCLFSGIVYLFLSGVSVYPLCSDLLYDASSYSITTKVCVGCAFQHVRRIGNRTANAIAKVFDVDSFDVVWFQESSEEVTLLFLL
ncbi:hypothetical protein V6N11_062231 [Hibiscus sabdariffa]|uniref:Uncharacterized protein n=1 Tax=Hibiscus sabdariffa TaxID=183260 RepID=A0ABR2PRX6_9ROSI